MAQHDLPGDGQPKARAAALPGPGLVHPVEPVEDPLPVRRRDADAGVGHLHPHIFSRDAGVHGDGAAVGGVLDGVAQHIHHHLLDAAAVSGDQGKSPAVGADQGVAVALGLQLHRPAHGLDGLPEGEADHLHVRPAGVQAAEGQQVLDDPGHPVRLADDDVQKAVLHGAGDVLAVPDGLRVAADVGQRGAQLVGDVGHELLAHLLVFPLGGDVVHYRHHPAVLPIGEGGQVEL